MKKFLCLLFVFCFASGCWAYNESPTEISAPRIDRGPVTVSPAFLDTLMSDSGLQTVDMVSVTPDGNRLWSIQGDLSQPLTGDLVDASKKFILDHARLFNLPDVRNEKENEKLLNVVRNEKSAGGHHISFQMMIGGYPVNDALIEIHLNEGRKICMAHGSLPAATTVTNSIRLSPAEAIERAKTLVGAASLYETPYSKLVLFPLPQEGALALAYVVVIPSTQPLGSFQITLDAETGAEYDRTNLMVFEHEGRGNVYKNHPLISPLTVEPMKHLASTTLTGLYCAMRNNKGPLSIKPDSVHLYDPNDMHFDEANVYYHINVVHDFFSSLGFTKLDRPVTTMVHYGDKLDNAVFDAGFGVLGFGDGDMYNSFAREESIVYHEYSHCVLNEIVKLSSAGEAGAMNEGQADYFGSSLSNDPVHGEYVAAKAGLPYIRTLNNSFHYPDDIVGGSHKDGRIWSGTLWDLRNVVGRDVADRLVHGSHYYVKAGRSTFMDGYNALLVADANLFSGKYKSAISGVMSHRGIRASSFRGAVLDTQDLRVMRAFRSIHGK
ncbi:MAG: M36 family metallopeptidase [Candidatus Ozemobacteraceae bacterium]